MNDQPAFPTHPVRTPDGRTDPDFYHGLTKREYIATKAMAAIIAANGSNVCQNSHNIAVEAVHHADSLIAHLAASGKS